MPAIRYVCLSDLHLGEEDSLLTDVLELNGQANPVEASPVLRALVECLRCLVNSNGPTAPKPTLILNGDLLELALAQTHEAAMAFERFMELTMAPARPLFDRRIVFLPGNHDHHLWEMGRESQYLRKIQHDVSGSRLPRAYHTTGMYLEQKGHAYPPSEFLTVLANRATGRSDIAVQMAYPNYAVVGGHVGGGARHIVFHHGHFIEPVYHAMSTARSLLFPDRTVPDTVYDLEAENFAWIDFLWSALGRSGTVGTSIEAIYEMSKDAPALDRLIDTASKQIAADYDIPNVPGDLLEAAVVKKLLRSVHERVVGTMERRRPEDDVGTGVTLSQEGNQGLQDYLGKYLPAQIAEEFHMPSRLAFVFGHTHRPFSEQVRVRNLHLGRVAVFNSGGWVVDAVDPSKDRDHGGAIVVVDDQSNIVNLRMYDGEAAFHPYIEEATLSGDAANPLCDGLELVLAQTPAVWSGFQEAAQRAIEVRSRNLAARIQGH